MWLFGPYRTGIDTRLHTTVLNWKHPQNLQRIFHDFPIRFPPKRQQNWIPVGSNQLVELERSSLRLPYGSFVKIVSVRTIREISTKLERSYSIEDCDEYKENFGRGQKHWQFLSPTSNLRQYSLLCEKKIRRRHRQP